MQRVFHSKEDQKLANRWLLIVVTTYSTAAFIGALAASLAPTSRDAMHATQMDATALAQIQRQADRVSRYHAARVHYATQDADANPRSGDVASAMSAASTD